MFFRLLVLCSSFYFFYFHLNITSLEEFQTHIFYQLDYLKEIAIDTLEQINKYLKLNK